MARATTRWSSASANFSSTCRAWSGTRMSRWRTRCACRCTTSRRARARGTKVVQVGEGSDELFSGYRGYAFFVDFHRRVWRPYRLLPRPIRRAGWLALGPALTMDRADVLERAAGRDGELYWGGAVA